MWGSFSPPGHTPPSPPPRAETQPHRPRSVPGRAPESVGLIKMIHRIKRHRLNTLRGTSLPGYPGRDFRRNCSLSACFLGKNPTIDCRFRHDSGPKGGRVDRDSCQGAHLRFQGLVFRVGRLVASLKEKRTSTRSPEFRVWCLVFGVWCLVFGV